MITDFQSTVNPNLELNPKNPPTVAQLRRNGYKVRVTHSRYAYCPKSKLIGELMLQKNLNPQERYQKGGETTVEITTPDGIFNHAATARCNLSDTFNRRKGVKICLGRICKNISSRGLTTVPF